MLICYVSDMNIPSKAANTIQVMNMCEALAKCGNRVVLFVSKKREPDEAIFDYYGVDPVFGIEELGCEGFKKSYVCAVKAALRAAGNNECLVYGRFLKGCFACLAVGKRVVLELHQPPESTRSVADFLLWRLGRCHLEAVITASYSLKRYLVARGVAEGRLFALTNASKPFFGGGASRGEVVVGYAGTVSSRKGSGVLGELALFLKRGFRGVVLRVLGRVMEGVPAESAGFVPYGRVKGELSTFDVALLPMRGTYRGRLEGEEVFFGVPLKLLDYMSVGLPVVASSNPLVEEVLDGKRGVLVEQSDLEAWKEALLCLCFSPAARRRLSIRVRDSFDRYTWSARAQGVLGVLKGLRNG